MDKNERNILAAYHRANAAQKAEGLSWYYNVHLACCQFASKYNKSIEVVAGITAALSPGLRWESNLEATRRILANESLAGIGIRYTANIRKAYRILKATTPSGVSLEFHGRERNKTRAFYTLLVNPSNPLTVCVDGHAFNIWHGQRIPIDKVPTLNRNRLYEKVSCAYINVARQLNLLPNQVQAITWLFWRHFDEVAPF